jgi:hypothetical protein
MIAKRNFVRISDPTSIAKVCLAFDIGTIENNCEIATSLLAELVSMGFAHAFKDPEEVGDMMVFEINESSEAAFQARIRIDEFSHQRRIPSHNHNQTISEILHLL